MQRINDRIVFSPSDLNHFLDCVYLTRLDRDAVDGRVVDTRRSGEADLLAAKGEAHEHAQLEQFRREGRSIAEIADPGNSADWAAVAAASRHAMQAGADVVYQAVLLAEGWRGRADFLVRVPTPSALGAWSYEVWDTKLTRHAKPSHVLQLAYYSEQIAAIQRIDPEWMHVVLGNGERVSFRGRDFAAYYRAVRSRFLAALDDLDGVSPYPVSHCGLCGYTQHCESRWQGEDHLSLVANIRRSHVECLTEAGVTTTAALAASAGPVDGISGSTLGRIRHQAALQTHHRTTGRHEYDLLPPDEENGFRLLPPPSAGDVFFDMEGFPFFEPAAGLEYLFGAVTSDATFHAFRAVSRPEEKRAFER